jgi:hypothetical protein
MNSKMELFQVVSQIINSKLTFVLIITKMDKK